MYHMTNVSHDTLSMTQCNFYVSTKQHIQNIIQKYEFLTKQVKYGYYNPILFFFIYKTTYPLKSTKMMRLSPLRKFLLFSSWWEMA